MPSGEEYGWYSLVFHSVEKNAVVYTEIYWVIVSIVKLTNEDTRFYLRNLAVSKIHLLNKMTLELSEIHVLYVVNSVSL